MLTSRLSLTLEKRPRAPAQVCSANKTLAALVEPWSPAVGPLPAFVSHFFGRLSEWLSCSLYAACMQWLLSGRRPAWLQRSSINIDFIELETGFWVFGNLKGLGFLLAGEAAVGDSSGTLRPHPMQAARIMVARGCITQTGWGRQFGGNRIHMGGQRLLA